METSSVRSNGIDMNLTIEDIDAQVKDSPLSKEESRNQFVRLTKELGLKHSFNFDEVWEVGEEVRKRKLHREKLVEFEEKLKKTGATLSEEECTLRTVLDDADVNVLLGVDDTVDIVVFGVLLIVFGVLLVFSRRTC